MFESVLLPAVPHQVAGHREGRPTGGADIGAVAGMGGALVSRQAAGL